jgi:hypothetical protein
VEAAIARGFGPRLPFRGHHPFHPFAAHCLAVQGARRRERKCPACIGKVFRTEKV